MKPVQRLLFESETRDFGGEQMCLTTLSLSLCIYICMNTVLFARAFSSVLGQDFPVRRGDERLEMIWMIWSCSGRVAFCSFKTQNHQH